MSLFEKWAALIDQAADYILVSLVVAAAGALSIKEWRKDPRLPLAAGLLGPVAGVFGLNMWGGGWAIALTWIGAIAGPGLIILAQDPQHIRDLVERALDRIAPNKDDNKK